MAEQQWGRPLCSKESRDIPNLLLAQTAATKEDCFHRTAQKPHEGRFAPQTHPEEFQHTFIITTDHLLMLLDPQCFVLEPSQ